MEDQVEAETTEDEQICAETASKEIQKNVMTEIL